MAKDEIEVVPFGAFRELMEHPGPVSSGLSCACDDYGVTLGAPHLFRSVFGRSHYVRMDCMRMGIVKEGFCSLMVNGKTYRCQPGDLIYINLGGYWALIYLPEESFSRAWRPAKTISGLFFPATFLCSLAMRISTSG